MNSYDLILNGHMFKWDGSEWGVCEVTPGSNEYGPDWADYPGVTWGIQVSGTNCGAGWYFSNGTGLAWQNGQWRGAEPYETNAGPSGPIWMPE